MSNSLFYVSNNCLLGKGKNYKVIKSMCVRLATQSGLKFFPRRDIRRRNIRRWAVDPSVFSTLDHTTVIKGTHLSG